MYCEFGEMLEDIPRDRIICRLSDSQIQRRLLTEAKLTFTKAVELSQSMESADKNSEMILSQRVLLKYTLLEPYVITVGMNIPQIPVHSENLTAGSAQKRDTLPEHVVAARLMLTDREPREPLQDQTNSHMELNKLSPQRLKKSSQILCTICSI